MSLNETYNNFCNRAANIFTRLECLDPQADQLLDEFAQLQNEASELRAAIESAMRQGNDFDWPVGRNAIAERLRLIEQESRSRQFESARRDSVAQLIKQLRSSKYEHRNKRFAEAGEEVRVQAIIAGEASLNFPDRCRMICADAVERIDLLSDWRQLGEEEQESLVGGWPSELTPIAELIQLIDGIVGPSLATESSDDLETDQKSVPSTDADEAISVKVGLHAKRDPSSVLPKNDAAERRAELLRSLGPSQVKQDILRSLRDIPDASSTHVAGILEPIPASEESGKEIDVLSEKQVAVVEMTDELYSTSSQQPELPVQFGVQPDSSQLHLQAASEGMGQEAPEITAFKKVSSDDEISEQLNQKETNEETPLSQREFDAEHVNNLAWEAISYDRFISHIARSRLRHTSLARMLACQPRLLQLHSSRKWSRQIRQRFPNVSSKI